MSVEEKLLTVAAGLEEINEGINLEAELINELQSIVDNIPSDSNGSYEVGYADGKQTEYDAFWDAFQGDYYAGPGKRFHYSYAFAYNGFRDVNYNPKYPIVPQNTNGISYLFTWATYITDTKVPITAYGKSQYAFNNAQKLKRIPKLIFSGATDVTGMFQGCTALEELYCEGELAISGLDLSACTKLNRESIESVIGVLSDTTSGLSVTLSKTAVINAFGNLTDEWSTLISSKSNWTINLV